MKWMSIINQVWPLISPTELGVGGSVNIDFHIYDSADDPTDL